MTVVGVLVRVDLDSSDQVERNLSELNGVSTVQMEEPGTLGLVIEAEDINAVHEKLTSEVRATEGVLTAWPVEMHFNPESEDATPRSEHDSSSASSQEGHHAV